MFYAQSLTLLAVVWLAYMGTLWVISPLAAAWQAKKSSGNTVGIEKYAVASLIPFAILVLLTIAFLVYLFFIGLMSSIGAEAVAVFT